MRLLFLKMYGGESDRFLQSALEQACFCFRHIYRQNFSMQKHNTVAETCLVSSMFFVTEENFG